MSKLSFVTPEEAIRRWSEFFPFIQNIAEESRGKFLPVDVFGAIARAEFQLWRAAEGGEVQGVILTRLMQFPRLLACEGLAVTGHDYKEWIGLIPEIESWAKERGCSTAMPIARRGWERVLKPQGYEATHVLLEKRI